MSAYLLEITIAGLPKLANQMARGHWSKSVGEANTWKRKVWKACWHLRPKTPLARAKLTLIRYSSREPDFDGLVSGFKRPIDGLVEAGILANDKSENIGRPEYFWMKCGPNHGRITIKVESILNEPKETK